MILQRTVTFLSIRYTAKECFAFQMQKSQMNMAYCASKQFRDNNNTSSIVISLFVSMRLNIDNRPHQHFLSKYIIFCCQTMHMNIICIEFGWKWQRIISSFFYNIKRYQNVGLTICMINMFRKASCTTNSIPRNKWRNDTVEYQRMNDWQDEGHF